MSGMKRLAKRGVVQAVARVAPVTWRWRKPGSLVVLMYHRVLPQDSPLRRREQPGMYVSPETLDLHLTELERRFERVHLDDWLRRAKQGETLPKIACAITFDDGWRDNYDFALPVRVKHQTPATIFLVSSYIGRPQRFWPNRLIELILKESAQPNTVPFPAPLRALIGPLLAQPRCGPLGPEDIAPVIRQAMAFDEHEIRAMVEAADEAGMHRSADGRDMLNREEIEAMAATGLIRFGSHSRTHFRLAAGASADVLRGEIVDSRAQLQQICRQPIDLFCYPNGVSGASAVDWVRRHYLGAVSTQTGWHTAKLDPYWVKRIRMHDDIARDRDGFLARLSGWL